MNKILQEAYEKTFETKPNDLKDWEMAKGLMENWNVPKLGEDLAKQVIFQVTNHIAYPSNEITQEIVGSAEEKSVELFSEFDGVTDEPHMDQIAHLENRYYQEGREGQKLL